MNSYIFLWANETWKRHVEEAKFGPVKIEYIAGDNRRPFSGFVEGDEVFVITVKQGQLYIGGRLIVGATPMSREAASRILVGKSLIQKDLYVLASQAGLSTFQPSTMVDIGVAKNLDLISLTGLKKPDLAKDGLIYRQAFRTPYRLTPSSANELRAYLSSGNLSAGSYAEYSFSKSAATQSIPASMPNASEPSEAMANEYQLEANRLENESAALKFLSETEVNAWVKQRLGQGTFRAVLFETFGRECPLSGLKLERLLIASHVRPWSQSDHHARQDPDNGLLLSITWDALFDKCLVTFDADGLMLVSPQLDQDSLKHLGLEMPANLPTRFLTPGRRAYLEHHRERCREAWVK